MVLVIFLVVILAAMIGGIALSAISEEKAAKEAQKVTDALRDKLRAQILALQETASKHSGDSDVKRQVFELITNASEHLAASPAWTGRQGVSAAEKDAWINEGFVHVAEGNALLLAHVSGRLEAR